MDQAIQVKKENKPNCLGTDKRQIILSEDKPIFHKNGTITREFLEDWLFYLNERTTQDLKGPQNFREYLTPERVVEVIFSVCKSLGQPPEVMYVSVELFDRFIVNHLNDLQVQLSARASGDKPEVSWTEVDQRVRKQVLLRILSCIQLASKLSSHTGCIKTSEVYDTLCKLGYAFNVDNIVKSELRVFETLKYRIDIVSPLAYAEALLEILNFNFKLSCHQFHPDSIYNTTLEVLDLYYLSRNKFYDLVYKMARGHDHHLWLPEDAQLMRNIKSDYMLLSCAVLVAAGAVHSPQMHSLLLVSLSKISSNITADIEILSSAFMNLINSG